MRDSIQTMVRSIHPLGRAMDQLQEDLEAMQREYSFWQHVRRAALRLTLRSPATCFAGLAPAAPPRAGSGARAAPTVGCARPARVAGAGVAGEGAAGADEDRRRGQRADAGGARGLRPPAPAAPASGYLARSGTASEPARSPPPPGLPQIEAVELEMARTREAIAGMKQDIAKNDATIKDLLAAIMTGGGVGAAAPAAR